MLITVLNILAMLCALYGSWSMVRDDRVNAGRSFLVGNMLNLLVGITVGNLALIITMIGFTYYTTMLIENHDRVTIGFMGAALFPFMTPAPDVFFQMDAVGLVATLMALYGSQCMVEGKITRMCWMWIMADLLFLYIAYTEGLIGLAIQSVIFVYYSIIRLNGWKLTGVFSFSRN